MAIRKKGDVCTKPYSKNGDFADDESSKDDDEDDPKVSSG